jgi:hypothetical protein
MILKAITDSVRPVSARHPPQANQSPAQPGRSKGGLMAKAWTMQGGTGHWPVLPGYQPG